MKKLHLYAVLMYRTPQGEYWITFGGHALWRKFSGQPVGSFALLSEAAA